jgi:hypothetical protein
MPNAGERESFAVALPEWRLTSQVDILQ